MEKVNFGVTKRGEEASLYVLENKNNTTIKVTDYRATLVSQGRGTERPCTWV